MAFNSVSEAPVKIEKEDWSPIELEKKELTILITYGLFVYLFIALFVIFIPINFRTIWVLVNIVLGYAILSNEKAREYYGSMFVGFKERKIWAYAILNLILIFSVLFMPFIFFTTSGGGGGEDASANPFISNYIFMLFIIPIVPLFADAETKIFQAWIIKGFHKKTLVDCKKCGRKSLPLTKCDLCGAALLKSDAFELSQYMPAIVLSGVIFGLAHVILVGSILPMILTIGGIFLGILYVKEGAMVVAKVHMLYNYLVIAIIIVGGVL